MGKGLSFYNTTEVLFFEGNTEEPKRLIYYNTTEVLFFEIEPYDEQFPLYAILLDFITGQGGGIL